MSTELRKFQKRIDEDSEKLWNPDDRSAAIAFWAATSTEYKVKFAHLSQSLAGEILDRIGTVAAPPTHSIAVGGILVKNGAFAGSKPATYVADFIDYLAQGLPTL